MRFIAFKNNSGKAALGARVGDELVDLTALGLPATLDELLRQGDAGMAAAKKALAGAKQRLPLAGLKYLPPLANPSKAFAIGLNYIDHAMESKFEAPKHPVIFQRFPSSWVAHGEAIVRPHVSVQFDYEAEFVAVIGKAGRYIAKDQALEHVAGYSVFNDGSIRDYQFRSNQWLWGKNFDNSGGFGSSMNRLWINCGSTVGCCRPLRSHSFAGGFLQLQCPLVQRIFLLSGDLRGHGGRLLQRALRHQNRQHPVGLDLVALQRRRRAGQDQDVFAFFPMPVRRYPGQRLLQRTAVDFFK